jgi:pyrroline-5-carboxylate reductase
VAQSSDVIFIAVKPQYVAPVLMEIAPHLTETSIIVSIAAGVTLQTIKVRVLTAHRCCERPTEVERHIVTLSQM